jgi:soluble lytic murein transglycosylase-like protein
MKSKVFSCFGLFCTALLLWPCVSASKEINRCRKYLPQVIREARFYAGGMTAPHALFMGQIEQESRCDAAVTAFDGGKGLGQFMDPTADWMQKREKALREISIKPNPYDPQWSIRALVLYDKWLYGQSVCPGWYYALRGYNGGIGLLNREIRGCGTCDRTKVEAECRRKVIKLKSGKTLDMCRDVNIPYYYLAEKKGEKYR